MPQCSLLPRTLEIFHRLRISTPLWRSEAPSIPWPGKKTASRSPARGCERMDHSAGQKLAAHGLLLIQFRQSTVACVNHLRNSNEAILKRSCFGMDVLQHLNIALELFGDENRLNDRTCILDLGPIQFISSCPAALSRMPPVVRLEPNFLWSSLSSAAARRFRSPAQDGDDQDFGEISFITCSYGVTIRHGRGRNDEVVRPHRDFLCRELR